MHSFLRQPALKIAHSIPRRPSKRKVATCRHCTTALKPGGVPRRPLSQSPPPSSPPSTTCSRTARCIRISAPITSIVVPQTGKKHAWSNAWQTSDTPSNSSRSPPEPRLWHRQQEEFVARSEQVSFLLVPHRALAGPTGHET